MSDQLSTLGETDRHQVQTRPEVVGDREVATGGRLGRGVGSIGISRG